MLTDAFVYPKKQDRIHFHTYESETYESFVTLTKRARRFFTDVAFDEILDEFERDFDPFFAEEFLRALRYIALLLPMEHASDAQLDRLLGILHPDGRVCQSRKISTNFDLFVAYMLKQIGKRHMRMQRDVDWSPWHDLVFAQMLPVLLKVPAPVKGVRKLPKILTKTDNALARVFFEVLGSDALVHVSKWIVYAAGHARFLESTLPRLQFVLESLKHLCHPSNCGSWTHAIDTFLLTMAGTLSKLLTLEQGDSVVVCALSDSVVADTPRAVVSVQYSLVVVDAIVNGTWSLVEKLVFSKAGISSSAGSFATCVTCNYLANIRPQLVIPRIIELASSSLDSLSEPHRTTSAIGLLCLTMSTVLNAAKSDVGLAPAISLLPVLVQGIDSNDQMKSIFTLALFANFAEATHMGDISEMSVCCADWSDACQAAKEMTSQFADVALLFTEQTIAFLRALPETNGRADGIDSYIGKLIMSVSEGLYTQLSEDTTGRCLDRWIAFITTECFPASAEVVGDVFCNMAETHGTLVAGRLMPLLLGRIEDELERGAGRLGTTNQANRTLNCFLLTLHYFLLRGRGHLRIHIARLKLLLERMLRTVVSRAVFANVTKLMYSVAWAMIQIVPLRVAPPLNPALNPFSGWGRWLACDAMQAGRDYAWSVPEEEDMRLALEWLGVATRWSQDVLGELLEAGSGPFSKHHVERTANLLAATENVMVCAQGILAVSSASDCGVSCGVMNEAFSREARELLQQTGALLLQLHPTVGSLDNLEIGGVYYNLLGSFVNARGADPKRSKSLIGALKRLGVNYNRHPRDRTRPVRAHIKTAAAHIKLRQDMRFILGDAATDAVLADVRARALAILNETVYANYRVLRLPAQQSLRQYYARHAKETRSFIVRSLAAMEADVEPTEERFKGFCFLFRETLLDVVADDMELLDRFVRILVTANEKPSVRGIKDVFKMVGDVIEELFNAYVPDPRSDSPTVVRLMEFLLERASCSDSWMTQCLALDTAHNMIESAGRVAMFMPLLRLLQSKSAKVRHLAQGVFSVAVFAHARTIDPAFYADEDIRATDLRHLSREEFARELERRAVKGPIVKWDEPTRMELLSLVREHVRWQVLDMDEGGSHCAWRQEQTRFLSKLLDTLTAEDAEEMLLLVETAVFGDDRRGAKIDAGRQRAASEWLAAVIGRFSSTDAVLWPRVRDMLLRCWSVLALEHVNLWTALLLHVFDGRDPRELVPLLDSLLTFFYGAIADNESVRIVTAMRMICCCYGQLGTLSRFVFDGRFEEAVLALLAHEYSAIGAESSRSLAFVVIHDELAGSRDKGTRLVTEAIARLTAGDSVSAVSAETGTVSSTTAFYSRYSRGILQFLANLATIPSFSGFWMALRRLLPAILAMLQADSLQLLEDVKKGLLSLFLTRHAPHDTVCAVSRETIAFVMGTTALSAKSRRFCLELVQLLLQNNYAQFHSAAIVSDFMRTQARPLVESSLVDVREASLGILLTLHRLDGSGARDDAELCVRELESGSLLGTIKTDDQLARRHGLVVRGCAIVMAEPYGVSPHLPPLLSALSRYVSDRFPIAPLVRSTFSDFRRTHGDSWALDRQAFTDEQLDAIGELLVAPSYYA